eukprot:g15775.t1
MNNVQNPLQANLEIDSAEKTLTKCQKCRILCGYESVLVNLLVFAVFAINTHILTLYNHVDYPDGPWWAFALLSGLSFLLLFSFVIRTCIALFPSKKRTKEKPDSVAFATLKARYRELKARYRDIFDVNGKYFLTKMYAAEAFEHIFQVYGMRSLYLCFMPVEMSLVVCIVFSVELAINIWATFHMKSQLVRDRLLVLDIFTDLFCVMFPWYYRYRYGGNGAQYSLITVTYPSISMLSKLSEVWEDFFRTDISRLKTRRIRRRKSILGLSHNQEVLETQLKHYPNWLRYSFTVLNVGFLLFFVVLAIVQLATRPSTQTCSDKFTSEVWNGCTVEVPFCKNPFVARCDCWLLELTNYSQREFPESFGQLSSLRRLIVSEGALEALPNEFGDRHAVLESVLVSSSCLTVLPESIGRLKNLRALRVSNSSLTALPESIGRLKNLRVLEVENNFLTALPESIGNLDSLAFFHVNNNFLTALPKGIGSLENLLSFSVYQNHLTALPDSLRNMKHLRGLWAWNNTFTSLPVSLGTINALVNVDVRHNQLVAVPSFSSTNLKYLGLEGNPLCENGNIPNMIGVEGMCSKQCAFDCPSVFQDNCCVVKRTQHVCFVSKSEKGAGLKT